MASKPPRPPDLWGLTWHDVDPARRTFNAAAVRSIVRALPPAARIPPPGADWRLVDIWYDDMTAALVEHYGPWVVGWPCSLSMENSADHGQIAVWHYEPPPITTTGRTLAAIAAAVVKWHELLVEIATDPHSRFAAASTPAVDGKDAAAPPAWRAVMATAESSGFHSTPEGFRIQAG